LLHRTLIHISKSLLKKMFPRKCTNICVPSTSVYRPSVISLCLSIIFFSFSLSTQVIPCTAITCQSTLKRCVDSGKRASTAQTLAARVKLGWIVQVNRRTVCQMFKCTSSSIIGEIYSNIFNRPGVLQSFTSNPTPWSSTFLIFHSHGWPNNFAKHAFHIHFQWWEETQTETAWTNLAKREKERKRSAPFLYKWTKSKTNTNGQRYFSSMTEIIIVQSM